MTVFETLIESWLWDLEAEGAEPVLDRLKGEIGLTGLVVPVVVPAFSAVRARPDARPRVLITAGGALFHPEPRYFAGTRLRPVPAERLRRGDPLVRVAQAAAHCGLKLRPAVHACRNAVVAERFPAAVVRDVFGEPVPGWLCPVNPDVREYLRGLIESLVDLCPQTQIEVREACFPPDRFADAVPRAGVPIPRSQRQLWSLCFCDSCQHLAGREGIDVASAARAVTGCIERLFGGSGPQEPALEAWIRDHPPLATFLEWRTAQIAALHAKLAESARGRLVAHAAGPPTITGFDPLRVAAAARIAVDLPQLQVTAVERLAEQLRAALEAVPPGREVGDWEISLVEAVAEAREPSALVAVLGRTAELGAAGATLTNYGLLPPARLDWLRQAIRYASRQRRDRRDA